MANTAPQETQLDTEHELECLMTRYAGGDSAAFEEIYRIVHPRLFGYLLRLTRDTVRAEDLLQVTFAKVHRARKRYEPGSAVMPWLFTIARNAFRDEYRGLRSRNEGVTTDGELPDSPVSSHAERVERREEMRSALMTVPKKQREAVVLTKLLGLSVAEAAAVVGTTANSLKIRVHRGLKGLRGYAWA